MSLHRAQAKKAAVFKPSKQITTESKTSSADFYGDYATLVAMNGFPGGQMDPMTAQNMSMLQGQLVASQGLLQGMLQQQAALQWQWGEREKTLLSQVQQQEYKVLELQRKLESQKGPNDKELCFQAEASLLASKLATVEDRVSQLSAYIRYVEEAAPEECQHLFNADWRAPARGVPPNPQVTPPLAAVTKDSSQASDVSAPRRYTKQRGGKTAPTEQTTAAGKEDAAKAAGNAKQQQAKPRTPISSADEALAHTIETLIALGCCADMKLLATPAVMRAACGYIGRQLSLSFTRFLKNYPAIFKVHRTKHVVFTPEYLAEKGLTVDPEQWEVLQAAKAALNHQVRAKANEKKRAERTGGRAVAKADASVETNAEAKTEAKTEAKADATADSRAEAKSETKPEATEAKADAKAEEVARSEGGDGEQKKAAVRGTRFKYKTLPCRYWQKSGKCKVGKKCGFIHGDNDPMVGAARRSTNKLSKGGATATNANVTAATGTATGTATATAAVDPSPAPTAPAAAPAPATEEFSFEF